MPGATTSLREISLRPCARAARTIAETKLSTWSQSCVAAASPKSSPKSAFRRSTTVAADSLAVAVPEADSPTASVDLPKPMPSLEERMQQCALLERALAPAHDSHDAEDEAGRKKLAQVLTQVYMKYGRGPDDFETIPY